MYVPGGDRAPASAAQPTGFRSPARDADEGAMPRLPSAGLPAVSLLLLAVSPASAPAATTNGSQKPRPTVRAVAPMTAGIGDRLTLRGRNFLPGAKRNTVLFKIGDRPSVTV